MKFAGIVLALALAFAVPFGGIASAQRDGQWVLLGTRNVTDRADHDVIVVTSAQGNYRRIKLTVGRSPVNFQRVVVHYRNGGDQEVELRETIRARGETRAIDLRGDEDRVIRSIEFWYEAKSIGRRGATVGAFGLT